MKPETGSPVLCLGFSNILQRRVLPALDNLTSVSRIEIASRRGVPDASNLPAKVGRCYGDFTEALDASSSEVVYVSTVNSQHAEWTERALKRGFHVIVDKPSFTDFAEAERLVEVAESCGRCLAEATVYVAHPQIELCKKTFAEEGVGPERITATFSMPPLAAGNFRYRADLGGGALWDLGPYAVSVGRTFFSTPLLSAHCSIGSRGGPDRVETAFSVMLLYSGGRCVVGHFGFDTEYRNEVTLLGKGVAVRIGRIFTTPPDLAGELEASIRNQSRKIHSVPGDSFGLFFDEVLQRIQRRGELAEFGRILLQDARALQAIREAAKES